MKRRLAFIVLLFSIVLIGSVTAYSYFDGKLFNLPKRFEVKHGMAFPKVDLYKADSDMTGEFSGNCKKIVFYLSADCSTCVEKLDYISTIIQLFSDKHVKFYLLWENEIPSMKINRAYISNQIQYSLKGAAHINNVVPEYYILDEKNNVEFIAQNDISVLVNKLSEEYKNKIDSEKISSLLIDQFSRLNQNYDSKEKTIMFFSSNSCESCIEVNSAITDNPEFQKKYNIITIGQEKDEASSNVIDDEFGIYFNLLKLKHLPCFIVLNNDKQIERIIDQPKQILSIIKQK